VTRTRIVFYGFAVALFNFLWGLDQYEPEMMDSAFNLLVMTGILLIGFYASDKLIAKEDK